MARRAHPFLRRRYDEAGVAALVAETRDRYQALIPELPFIGGSANQFTKVIEINGWIVSLLRAMKARGATTEEVVGVCCEVADDFIASLPRVLLWAARGMAFSRLVKRRMSKQAARSQRREFPEDFVYTFEEEPDGSWALSFSECAVNKFYAAQGVEELAPFCSFFDVIYSRHLAMGIDASETIGLGCPACRLRYRRGERTRVPAALEGLIPASALRREW